MSEDLLKMNVFDMFSQTQETLQEAEERAKQEAGAPKVERFRIGEDGEYMVRILPIAPKLDEEGKPLPMERKGFEYPLHQFFLKIELPSKDGKKTKNVNIPVIRTTDKEVGLSADLIDTYVQIAREMYADDDDVINLLKKGSFDGGLRWSYARSMYVLDLNDKRKGPMLWQISNSQYNALNDERIRIWKKLAAKSDKPVPCTVSSVSDAFPVVVVRNNNNGKIEYKFSIETLDGKDKLADTELQKLLDMPRISDFIYRFTRYQLEAELEFLRQYDQIHSMNVCEEPDFKETYEKIMGELPSDDTSHFDIRNLGKEGTKDGKTTIDSLWDEHDALEDQGLNDKKSSEYQQLRGKILQFIQDNNLDYRVSRDKSNQQVLEDITDIIEGVTDVPEEEKPEPVVEQPKEEEEKPKRKKRPAVAEKDDEPVPTRSRRSRPEPEPELELEPEPEPADEPEADDDTDDADNKPADEPVEQQPAPRQRRRRLR